MAATRGGDIGERRIGLPRRNGEPLFFLAPESRGLSRERRGSTGAVLYDTGEGYRVFVVGNETDDLELVIRRRRIATVGRAEKAATLDVSSVFSRLRRHHNGTGLAHRLKQGLDHRLRAAAHIPKRAERAMDHNSLSHAHTDGRKRVEDILLQHDFPVHCRPFLFLSSSSHY